MGHGLLRVRTDVSLQDIVLRRAVALGRIIFTLSPRAADTMPGLYYRVLSKDADAQFREILEVFGLEVLVQVGGSRCGICNARQWRTLTPEEVAGKVPEPVRLSNPDFSQCGCCKQIFWNGEKYVNTMDSLKAAVVQDSRPPVENP